MGQKGRPWYLLSPLGVWNPTAVVMCQKVHCGGVCAKGVCPLLAGQRQRSARKQRSDSLMHELLYSHVSQRVDIKAQRHAAWRCKALWFTSRSNWIWLCISSEGQLGLWLLSLKFIKWWAWQYQSKWSADALELNTLHFSSIQFSLSVVSDSLWPHGLQHARPPCPSPTPRAYSNSCRLSWWCHPTISFSVVPFSSHLQSFRASGSFPMSRLFTSGGQSIGV